MQLAIHFFIVLVSIGTLHDQNSKIETIIRQKEKQITEAIVHADTMTLQALWSPAFMVNTPRNTIAPDRNAVFQVARQGLINYASFDRNIEGVLVMKHVVITMGNEIYTPRVDLPEAKAGQQVKRRFTNVWTKVKGNWMQVGRHASVICEK